MATATAYGGVLQALFNKEIDWVSDTCKAMLLTSAYTPNQDTHDYLDDISASEASGAGYTAGGQVLTGKSLSYDAGTNTLSVICANPVWAGLTTSFRYVAFYVSTGTPSTSPLLCYADFGSTQSFTAQTLTLLVPAGGILQHTVA